MVILGIETSCDETSVAIVKDGKILSNVISSQWVHKKFGGVVPELASRAHIRNIIPITKQALSEAKISKDKIDGIAVTYSPGLIGSLLVGLNYAKAMALGLQVPLIGIHHIEGHIWANFLETDKLKFPFIALVISGGHTQLFLVKDIGSYTMLGKTHDDASGEAFDKVAKMLNLGYPGGPVIDKMAKQGNPNFIKFPKAFMDEENNFDFSFSGLKTAVLYQIRSMSESDLKAHLADICASFQKAVVDVLVEKSIRACKKYGIKQLALAGGVAANSSLREELQIKCEAENIQLFIPSLTLCTDNGGMIAKAGEERFLRGQSSSLEIKPEAYLQLDEI